MLHQCSLNVLSPLLVSSSFPSSGILIMPRFYILKLSSLASFFLISFPFLAMFWEISINRNYGLHIKCPPQACVFEHLVPSWWRYFETFWNLWECGLISQLPMWDGPFSWYPLLVLTEFIFGISDLTRCLPWTEHPSHHSFSTMVHRARRNPFSQ